MVDARTLDAQGAVPRNNGVKKGQKRSLDADEVLLDRSDFAGAVVMQAQGEEVLLAQGPGDPMVVNDAGAGVTREATGTGDSSVAGTSTVASSTATAPAAATTTFSTSGFVLGGVALAAAVGGGSGGETADKQSPAPLSMSGQVTAGQAIKGLLVQAYDKDGKAIQGASAVTGEGGTYNLSIGRQYAGQAIVIKVTDPDATDGQGYIDEATGESKDFGVTLRSAVVVGNTDKQTAQITPLTELAARKVVSETGVVNKTATEVAATNKAVGALFGVTDPVGGEAPNVVGKGDGNTANSEGSNGYGKALALLSGMDAVNERLGASDPVAATLERLDQAINVSLSGRVSAAFQGADVEAMNLLSQAVAEISSTYSADTSLVDVLSNIALDVAKSGASGSDVAVLITSASNLLGANKSTTLNFQFDNAPTQAQYDALKAAIQVQGGRIGDLSAFDATKTQYTASLTQLGSEEPRVWLADDGSADTPAFFANELRLVLDMQAPTLSIARIEGLRDGLAQSVVKQGDVLRVTLSSSESLALSGDAPTLTLNIGNSTVSAALNTTLSGTRNLVFEYTVGNDTDTDGVSVVGLNLGNGKLQDFAGNDAAPLNTAWSGMAPLVDTTAPVVLSQSPADNSTVGNASAQTITLQFSESVSKGAGTFTLKRGDTVVQTFDVANTALSVDGKSLSFTHNGTLTVGEYTLQASSGAVRDLAGNTWDGAGSADGSWNFRVGDVNLGVNKLSTDNILNNTEASGALSLSGTLAGAEGLLATLTASDLQVWVRPAAGGAAVAASGVQINGGVWSASVADASALSGGYVVQAIVNKGDIQASATGVFVIDRSAQMSLANIAGDDRLSLLEQTILKSGTTSLALGFVAEKGASGTLTLSNGSAMLEKTFSNATGLLDNSLRLTKEDLVTLGAGNITVTGRVTDVAGNTANISKTLVIEAASVPATITQVALNALDASPLGVGDKLVAQISFDKAVALSGTDATLALQVGSNTRSAKWIGLSADRKTLSFEYTVVAGDMDSDGVNIAANALRLNNSSLKDLSGATANTQTALTATNSARVDTTVVAAPDLTGVVTEAGITSQGAALAGVPSTGGKLVTDSGVSVQSVSVGDQNKVLTTGSTVTSLIATTIEGTYGTWTVGADGSYLYRLDNSRGATQALAAELKVTDILSFTSSSGSVGQAVVTVTGSNDAPVARVGRITKEVSEGADLSSLNLLELVTDPDGDTLRVADLSFSSSKTGSNAPGSGSSQLPAGLTLSGSTLSLDPGHSAFDSLKAGEKQIITARYTVNDEHGGSVVQTATITVNGSNDAPTAQGGIGAQTAIKNGLFSLDVAAYFADADSGDTRRYALSGPGANGLSIDANGRITGTFSNVREAQNVTVTLTDGASASATQGFDLRVVDQLVLRSLFATGEGATSAGKAGDTLRLVVEFSEPVTISGVPTLTLDVNGTPVTATFEQTASAGQLAYFTATVPADNNGHAISVQAINLPNGASVVGNSTGTALLLSAVNQATNSYTVDNALPAITTTTLNVAENTTAVGTLAATDATALAWSWNAGGVDNELFELSAGGALTLKAGKNFESDARSYSVSVKATDAVGQTSTQTITVNLSDVNEAPSALTLDNALSTLAENASTNARTKVADIAITDDALGTDTIALEGEDKGAFEVDGRALYLKAGVSLDYETKPSYSVTVKVQDSELTGAKALSENFILRISDVDEPPSASNVLSEAPHAYDQGALSGATADTFMLRFSETVNADLIQAAMAQGKVQLQGADGTLRNLGKGAALEAFLPSNIVITGMSAAANGTYTSLWSGTAGSNTEVPDFAAGFGLFSPNSFSVNTNTTIYKKTNADGSTWYIWQQTGWRTWIISESSPVDTLGNAKAWFISSNSNSTDPALRTAVLGVAGWVAKSGALQDGGDPWAGTTRLSGVDLEPNGWGRTYLLAMGAGQNAKAGDTLVIDKSFVKDGTGNFATSDVSFALPADITRPKIMASTPATVQGVGSDGAVKTSALAVGDKVRVTLTLDEPVTVSTSVSPSVTLELDAGTRQATINRDLSFPNGTASNTLVFDYVVKENDSDVQGGITLGAYNRNNSNAFDLSGNRLSVLPTNLVEADNAVRIAADNTAPELVSVNSADKAIVTGAVSDTFTFKFSEALNVDTLEAALASSKVKVVAADGSTRALGEGARVEATYPMSLTVSGFSPAADGAYSTLWSPAYNKNSTVPSFSGFSTSGTSLSADASYPIYKHTDSAGQDWYLWRPWGWANYVLTPESSRIGNQPQSWWASGNGADTGSSATAREGVLLAGEWYANSGPLANSQAMRRSDNKLGSQPALDATDWAYTFTLALGAGHEVQAGDTLHFEAGVVADTSGNANTSELSINLPTDSTRPVLGEATVKGMVFWSGPSSDYVEVPSTQALTQGNLIRVEIPVSETIHLYYPGGPTSTVALDIGGRTRYATINMQLSSTNGSTDWGFASDKLVFEYWIQPGDTDSQGGITVGAMNRGNIGMYDAASNRPWVPTDVREVANALTVVDNSSPYLWTSYASGSAVVLKATESLDAANLPNTSAFTVTINGTTVAVQSLAVTNGNYLVLTLANPLSSGQRVSVRYTDPSSANDAKAVQDLAGNDAGSNILGSVVSTVVPSIAYTSTSFDKVELAGESELHFTVKYTDLVRISGTPRLVLQVSDGTTSTTAYADYEAYSNTTGGQLGVEFVYRPVSGAKGQVSVTALDLNGGSITAYDSVGSVAASTTLSDTSFFTPFTWVYPEDLQSAKGDAANNLLAPWMGAPENTPHSLTSSSATGGDGDRDVLAMTVLLPSSVASASAAKAYSLNYNVTDAGVRQVLLKSGSTTLDTYTVPADADWPTGVEQLIYHAVYKDSAGRVQFADIGDINLTLGTHEYIDPVNSKQRWVQGSLNADAIDMTGRDALETIFIEGEQGNDTITGHDGVDIIRGGGGDNLINAGLGNDQVVVRRGSDTIDGGAGTDILRFDLAGNEKKITLDAGGVIHVYSANGSWSYGFVPDGNGWVERYRLSSDYGNDGSNRIAVFDVALGRNVAIAKNMEQLQWRLDDNNSGRTTNSFEVGTSGDDTISNVHMVLAGAGNDTISLGSAALHVNDWRNGNRAVLIDGGSGRDVLQLNTYVGGQLSQAFEQNTTSNINVSRVIKNIEGLNLMMGGSIDLAAADIVNLYDSGSNQNAWGNEIGGLDSGMRQFLVIGASGSINLTDASAWVRKNSTVTYDSQNYAVLEHASSGVQLVVDNRISLNGQYGKETSIYTITSNAPNDQITEGNSGTTPVTFTITRSGDISAASMAYWSRANGSTNSADFSASSIDSGQVSFAAGQASQTVRVDVRGDSLGENQETFGIRVWNASTTGARTNTAETWVTITNDDGWVANPTTIPVVTRVRTDAPDMVFPDTALRLVVEFDQSVTVSGTPRLSITLTDPTGAQQPRTVYANFVPNSASISGFWVQQSSLEFVYNYGGADVVGAGWTYHINGLENNNGSTIKSDVWANGSPDANLALNSVDITSGAWLFTSELVGITGGAYNDGLFGFDTLVANNTVPHTLDANAANGGMGDRDLLGIPVLLPASVTTLEQAKAYYLSYEVVADSSGNATARTVKLYQTGNSTAVDTYTVPLDPDAWPTEVEALAYRLKFKDANGNVQETDQANDHLVLWRSGYMATDAVNGDISRQGSYGNDNIDLSSTATATRVDVRGNQGNDTIIGHAGSDVLFGDAGNDVVNAGAGNDFVALSEGVDTLDGGAGTDVLAFWVAGFPMTSLTADGKLEVKSATGTLGSNGFVPDSNGYHLDWTFDLDGQTGAILAQKAQSTEISTATGFEKIRFHYYLYQQASGEKNSTFDVVVGTSGNDTLNANTQDILHGLDGDDTFNVVIEDAPLMMGGNGNDTFVLGAKAFGRAIDSGVMIHGGAGTDTLKAGSDIADFNFVRPISSIETELRSIEAIDITGNTAQGELGNTLTMTPDWLRDLTDPGSSRSLTVTGDANDRVNLRASDNWTWQASDLSGYNLYQTIDHGETLKLYIATSMSNAVIG